MKKIVFGTIAATAFIFALAPFSPASVTNAASTLNEVDAAVEKYNSDLKDIESLRSDAELAKNTFDSERTFEVHYSDISNVLRVLYNVSGITVSEVTVVDPEQGFAVVSPYIEGSYAEALKISMTATDTKTILEVLDRMEFPIYSLYIREPNYVDLIYLTGGGT